MTYEIQPKMAFANYQALHVAIVFDKELKDAQFPWAEMLKSGKFPINYSSVEAARDDHDFFEYEISTRPREIPKFLQ